MSEEKLNILFLLTDQQRPIQHPYRQASPQPQCKGELVCAKSRRGELRGPTGKNGLQHVNDRQDAPHTLV